MGGTEILKARIHPSRQSISIVNYEDTEGEGNEAGIEEDIPRIKLSRVIHHRPKESFPIDLRYGWNLRRERVFFSHGIVEAAPECRVMEVGCETGEPGGVQL